jgi:uncharacterized protein (DUF2147 family)
MLARTLLGITTLSISSVVFAQMSPVGTWRSFDEKTKEIKAELVVTQNAGIVTGKISKLLLKDADQNAICDDCTDDRKNKPIIGLEVIRGAKKAEGKDVWEEGKILDPENGKNYTLRLTPIDGGKKLEVRGSVFGIGRTQTWVRIQ